jgi:hypothetical protein
MIRDSESAVLCEVCLGGYWSDALTDDLFSGHLDRVILGVCRSLRERRFVRFDLGAVVAHVRKLKDGRLLERLAEIVNPDAMNWWDGERHLQFHLRRLVQLRQIEARRRYALEILSTVDSNRPLDLPTEPQFTDPTPALMDRQGNLRRDRIWLDDQQKQKPRLQLAAS